MKNRDSNNVNEWSTTSLNATLDTGTFYAGLTEYRKNNDRRFKWYLDGSSTNRASCMTKELYNWLYSNSSSECYDNDLISYLSSLKWTMSLRANDFYCR